MLEVASNFSSRHGIPQQFQIGKPSNSSHFKISQTGHVVPLDYNPHHSAFPVTKQLEQRASSFGLSHLQNGYNTIVNHNPQHVAVPPVTSILRSQPTSFDSVYPQTDYIRNTNLDFGYGGFPPATVDREDHVLFSRRNGYKTEISGRADHNLGYPVNGLRPHIEREMAMFLGRTLTGDRYTFNELQRMRSLPFLRQQQHGREEHLNGYITEISGRADCNVGYPVNGLRPDTEREMAMFHERTLNGDRYISNELQRMRSLPFSRTQQQHDKEEHFYK